MLSFQISNALVGALACLATITGVEASPVKNHGHGHGGKGNVTAGHWVDTWTAMPQLAEYANLPLPPFVSTILLESPQVAPLTMAEPNQLDVS